LRKGKFSSALVAIIGAAIVYGLFWFQYKSNNSSYNVYLVVNMMVLLWVPMLTILLFLGADPASFGFTGCTTRRTWGWVAALFGGLLLLMLIAAPWDDFQRYYPVFRRWSEFSSLPAFRVNDKGCLAANPFMVAPLTMLYAEASYGMYLFCWEFFFRGYLLFGLQRSVGSVAAVIVQAAAFGLLHYGKPEMIPSFAAGIILGILALRAKSFFPGFVLHWAAAVCFDFLVEAARHG